MTDYTVTKFGVANFMAISKFTVIEFNPITLLIGDSNSGKSSLLCALKTFVESIEPERYLDVKPFYFDKAGNYLDFANVSNKYSSENSCLEYHFIIARKPEKEEKNEIANITYDKYDVSIKFGMDTERIRLKETKIKVLFENDDEIELLHFVRAEKTNYLKLNIPCIIETTKAIYSDFYENVYESDSEKLIGDLVSYDIEKEIMELGCKGFSEDRQYENGVYFPKTLFGVIRYYKYYLSDIFFSKFGEDVNSAQYKCANNVIENVYNFIKSKLALITDAIDVIFIDCSKLKVEVNVLPSKYYNENIFKKRLLEYIEEKNYEVETFIILKQLVKEYGIAEDISIEGDYTDGYSIYITYEGAKVNLIDADISKQHIIGTLLMILMNGKFDMCFKG